MSLLIVFSVVYTVVYLVKGYLPLWGYVGYLRKVICALAAIHTSICKNLVQNRSLTITTSLRKLNSKNVKGQLVRLNCAADHKVISYI